MSKTIMYIIISVTTLIGGWIPTLWGASMLGFASIFGSLIGGIVGVYLYWKAKQYGYID